MKKSNPDQSRMTARTGKEVNEEGRTGQQRKRHMSEVNREEWNCLLVLPFPSFIVCLVVSSSSCCCCYFLFCSCFVS